MLELHRPTSIERSVVRVGLACLLAATACPAAGAQDVSTEARVARVINGLHELEASREPPTETWTLSERMRHYSVPGVSIAVIHADSIAWARAYGSAGELGRGALSDSTLFQAASISKPLTALATFRLADKGLLNVDDSVTRYLRSWSLPADEVGWSDSVTISLLLAHMGGLNVPGFPGYPVGEILPTLIEILDGSPPANTPAIRVVRRPGSDWSYSGGGYVVLQQVLEDVTDQDFASLMHDLVLQPTGMRNSTFSQPLPSGIQASVAAGHDAEGAPVASGWHNYPEMAAAGLWTTASDLARFILAVRAARSLAPDAVLSAESSARFTKPRYGSFSEGLLVRRNGGHEWLTFNGGNEGYRALMYGYLTASLGAVVMTNGDEGLALANEIINSIALEYGWPDFVPETQQ